MQKKLEKGLPIPVTHLILALDTATADEGFKVLDACSDVVDCVKLNYPLILREGLKFAKQIKQRYGIPVFADLKIADVPHTNEGIIKRCIENECNAVMVHGIVGPDGLESALKAADGMLDIVVQTEFTHPGGVIFTQPIADSLAELARKVGCQAVQSPGNRPQRIQKVREIIGPDMKIVCCGVGAQGGGFHEAIEAGGDFPIVGRAIYNSADPRAAALKMITKN